MAFYDLNKQERSNLVLEINAIILNELKTKQIKKTVDYFNDEDTYIRKSAYLYIGRTYFSEKNLQPQILKTLNVLFLHEDFKIRQTVINAVGEIGKKEFDVVQKFFDKGLFDVHHSPRNAVIGSIKKNGRSKPKTCFKLGKKIFTAS